MWQFSLKFFFHPAQISWGILSLFPQIICTAWHRSVYCRFSPFRQCSGRVSPLLFYQGDYSGLHHYLSSADWSAVMTHCDVNAQVSWFTEIVKSGMGHTILERKLLFEIFILVFPWTLEDRAHKKARGSGLGRLKIEFRIHHLRYKKLYKKTLVHNLTLWMSVRCASLLNSECPIRFLSNTSDGRNRLVY